jgi:hypothetical protein
MDQMDVAAREAISIMWEFGKSPQLSLPTKTRNPVLANLLKERAIKSVLPSRILNFVDPTGSLQAIVKVDDRLGRIRQRKRRDGYCQLYYFVTQAQCTILCWLVRLRKQYIERKESRRRRSPYHSSERGRHVIKIASAFGQ